MKKYVQLKVVSSKSWEGVAIMEVVPYTEENNLLPYKNIDVTEMMNRDIISHPESTGKAEVWLNTPEGMEYFESAEHIKIL